jgi:hypothetical protein
VKIHKYQIPIINSFNILLPVTAVILSFQMKNNNAFIWVIVDEIEPPIPRNFRLVGTGHNIDFLIAQYIGTIQDDIFVWHLFEEKLI